MLEAPLAPLLIVNLSGDEKSANIHYVDNKIFNSIQKISCNQKIMLLANYIELSLMDPTALCVPGARDATRKHPRNKPGKPLALLLVLPHFLPITVMAILLNHVIVASSFTAPVFAHFYWANNGPSASTCARIILACVCLRCGRSSSGVCD